MKPETLKKVEMLAKITRPIMLQRHRRNCCIATVRALCRAFAALDIVARPLACEVHVFNQAFAQALEQENHYPDSAEEAQRWLTDYGAFSIGITPHGRAALYSKPNNDEMPAHLVCVVEDEVFIDASLDQINRPQYNVMLPRAIVADINAEFLTGSRPLQGQSGYGAHECLTQYRAMPDYELYLNMPAWAYDWQTNEDVADLLGLLRLLEHVEQGGTMTKEQRYAVAML